MGFITTSVEVLSVTRSRQPPLLWASRPTNRSILLQYLHFRGLVRGPREPRLHRFIASISVAIRRTLHRRGGALCQIDDFTSSRNFNRHPGRFIKARLTQRLDYAGKGFSKHATPRPSLSAASRPACSAADASAELRHLAADAELAR